MSSAEVKLIGDRINKATSDDYESMISDIKLLLNQDKKARPWNVQVIAPLNYFENVDWRSVETKI